MLEASPQLKKSLARARGLHDVWPPDEAESQTREEVKQLIDTEWLPLAERVATKGFPSFDTRSRDSDGNPKFYSGWVTIAENNGDTDFLQAQIEMTISRFDSSDVDEIAINIRLGDKAREDVFSNTHCSMLIKCSERQKEIILRREVEPQSVDSSSVTPDNPEDWQAMLGSLAQLKEADFSGSIAF